MYVPQKQLRETIPDNQLWDCSSYVVGEVFRALRQSFANARGIQVNTPATTAFNHGIFETDSDMYLLYVATTVIPSLNFSLGIYI